MNIKIKNDGWVHVTTPEGEAYGCQVNMHDWWYETVGNGNVYCGEKNIPTDVVAAVDAACPTRVK